MTRGHNIVADGWAANPHTRLTPNPTPLPTQTHTQKACFPTLQLMLTDGLTDQPTNGPTDGRTKPLIELRVRN